MRSKSGFTLVELVVVITVIVILSVVSILTYKQIRAEARDTKRESDIITLANFYEKYYDRNGAYPGGCSRYTASPVTACGNANATSATPHHFGSDSTLSTITQAFPDLPATFGDPNRTTADAPFSNSGYPYTYGTNIKHYFYIGQSDALTTNQWGFGPINVNSSSEVYCAGDTSIGFLVPAGPLPKSTTFALGYWSEVDRKWYIYQGRHGTYELVRLSNDTKVRGTSVGTQCVFVE